MGEWDVVWSEATLSSGSIVFGIVLVDWFRYLCVCVALSLALSLVFFLGVERDHVILR